MRIWTILLVTAVVLVAMPGAVTARQPYLDSFNNTYSNPGPPLNSCYLCHSSGSSLNPFGDDYLNAGHSFKGIEGQDSDGDTYSNITEINARTMPGDASSHPQLPPPPPPPPTRDTSAPKIRTFTLAGTSSSLTVPITAFVATDNVGVTGYYVSISASKPASGAAVWKAKAPKSYAFVTAGSKKLYAFAKDAAGNISASTSDGTVITLPPPPAFSGRLFTHPLQGVSEAPPIGWGRSGSRTGIWSSSIPFQAQGVDGNGLKILGPFTYAAPLLAASGAMVETAADNLVFGAVAKPVRSGVFRYTVEGGGMSGAGILKRRPMKCDSCHQEVLVHAGGGPRCVNCHANASGVAVVVHGRHAASGVTECFACHATGFASADRHLKADANRDCTFCHGALAPAAAFKPAPNCGSCHDTEHAVPDGANYATAAGHGGMLCSSCHGSPHRVRLPVTLGDGVNNNCVGCHADKIDGHNGPSCGDCHGTSLDPHLAHLP